MDRRKLQIYAAVVGVGLTVLAVDRFSGEENQSGPAEARAADPAVAIPPDRASTSTSPAVRVEAAAFPRDLPAAAALELMRDAFTMTDKVREVLVPPPPPPPAGPDKSGKPVRPRTPGRPGAAEFVRSHTLSAVLIDGEWAVAVVDGRVIHPGQSVDGCCLKRVVDNRAVFECGDGAAALAIGDGLRGGPRP